MSETGTVERKGEVAHPVARRSEGVRREIDRPRAPLRIRLQDRALDEVLPDLFLVQRGLESRSGDVVPAVCPPNQRAWRDERHPAFILRRIVRKPRGAKVVPLEVGDEVAVYIGEEGRDGPVVRLESAGRVPETVKVQSLDGCRLDVARNCRPEGVEDRTGSTVRGKGPSGIRENQCLRKSVGASHSVKRVLGKVRGVEWTYRRKRGVGLETVAIPALDELCTLDCTPVKHTGGILSSLERDCTFKRNSTPGRTQTVDTLVAGGTSDGSTGITADCIVQPFVGRNGSARAGGR